MLCWLLLLLFKLITAAMTTIPADKTAEIPVAISADRPAETMADDAIQFASNLSQSFSLMTSKVVELNEKDGAVSRVSLFAGGDDVEIGGYNGCTVES